LTSICTANKRDGSPCTLPVYGASDLCWAHSPETAERRRRGQSRGGKGKPSKEIQRISARIEQIAEDVLANRIDKGRGQISGQLLSYVLNGLKISLAAREQEEIIGRLEMLEQENEAKKGRRSWG
jgi:hypothetical protein